MSVMISDLIDSVLQTLFSATRLIGIQFRIKKTTKGESKPTIVTIFDPSSRRSQRIELATESDELDFGLDGALVKWRDVADGEDISHLPKRHIKVVKKTGKKQVPAEKIAITEGDVILMSLGAGDELACFLDHKAKAVGATVLRCKPADLKDARGKRESVGKDVKADDSALIIQIAQNRPELFRPLTARTKYDIRLQGVFRRWEEIQRHGRIPCEQRIRAALIGETFLLAGEYPNEGLDIIFKKAKAANPSLQAIIAEELRAEAELTALVEAHPIYREVLSKVGGLGPKIAARILVAVKDIDRFPSDSHLASYCGVAPRHDVGGSGYSEFPRRRHGLRALYNPTGRQALYLLGEQWNKMPKSEWGARIRMHKAAIAATTPQETEIDYVLCRPIVDAEGKESVKEFKGKRWVYTKGWIHRKAIWRTLREFVEWMYTEWKSAEAKRVAAGLADAEIEVGPIKMSKRIKDIEAKLQAGLVSEDQPNLDELVDFDEDSEADEA